MATGALVPVEEYLNTTYHPDRDYVDGELIERNMGEQKHGRLQGMIFAWLLARESRLRIRGLVEVRLRITPTRFRIPGVMVLPADAPDEPIITTITPLVCVEILSRSDTLNNIRDRLEDYFSVGVPACWVIDPIQRLAWIATPDGLTKVTDGVLRTGNIEMPLVEVIEEP